jgi:hypothetical protein
MIRISRFNLAEYKDIFEILKDAGIPFQAKPEIISIGVAGGYHEYHIFVSKEDVRQTIRLLKKYFGLIKIEPEPLSGECPACGFEVVKQLVCPDCGLSFWPNPSRPDDEHPFVEFLTERGLL